MKKETLLEIILGTVGGLIFAIGMCLCLLPGLQMLAVGIIVAIIGVIVLLCIIPVYKKQHPKKEQNTKSKGVILTWVIGSAGALLMGFGMSEIMVGNAAQTNMAVGIACGIAGLLVCVLNYPVYAYIKSK